MEFFRALGYFLLVCSVFPFLAAYSAHNAIGVPPQWEAVARNSHNDLLFAAFGIALIALAVGLIFLRRSAAILISAGFATLGTYILVVAARSKFTFPWSFYPIGVAVGAFIPVVLTFMYWRELKRW